MHSVRLLLPVFALLWAGLAFAFPARLEAGLPAPLFAPISPPDECEVGCELEKTVIGTSVQGRDIEAYWFGQGRRRLVLVGGLHGGYEQNTVRLAYRVIAELHDRPELIPLGLRVAVIPVANPDGVAKAASAPEAASLVHRLNANGVDLNRNWDCAWQPSGHWRTQPVGAGSAPFSEPEVQALRDFLTYPPAAVVVFWHSAAGAVLAGQCGQPLALAEQFARAYAHASEYPFLAEFNTYAITGASADWLSGQGIPAIDVELHTHEEIDWRQNLSGVLAVFAALKP